MRRALAVLAMTGLLLGLSATTASAHSLLTSSTPADGAALQSPPARVTLTFTEPPDPGLSTINVLGPSGTEVDTGPVQKPAGDPLTIQVAPPAGLPNGVYTVTWRVVSEADGHLSAGSFAFGVGVVPTPGAGGGQGAQAPQTPPPSPASVAGRWGLYWGLAILLGGSVGGTFVLRKVPSGQRAVFAGAWLIAAVGLIVVIVSRASTVDVGVGELLSSSAGRPLVAQAIAVAVAGATVGWFLVAPRWTSLPAVGLATAAAMLAHAYAGHAGAPSSFRWLNVLAQWVHLLAVGVWVGGLVWLLLILRSTEGAERIRAATRFSLTAAVALGVVALSGIQRAISEVGGVSAWLHLFATSFGVALFLKLVLFAGLVALGARNRYRNVPGLARGTRPVGPLFRTVSAELVVAVGIFGVTGVLTELPPAKTAGAAKPPAAAKPVVAAGSDFATTMKAKLVANPGTIGINEFTVTLTDYDTGAPVEADAVSLGFTLAGNPDIAPSDLNLEPVKIGRWDGQGSALSIDGAWNVEVLVIQGADSRTIDLTLQPRPPEQDLTKVETAGAPTIYTITFPGGASVQAYVEPGTSGPNEVHVTYFDPAGNELTVQDLVVDARPLDGALESLKVRRFGPGHFVADGDVDAGPWRFWMRATEQGNQSLVAYFDQRIEA
jgi:copper transport protein